jgi:hypothetical protein
MSIERTFSMVYLYSRVRLTTSPKSGMSVMSPMPAACRGPWRVSGCISAGIARFIPDQLRPVSSWYLAIRDAQYQRVLDHQQNQDWQGDQEFHVLFLRNAAKAARTTGRGGEIEEVLGVSHVRVHDTVERLSPDKRTD